MRTGQSPRVSIAIPSYNHAAYVVAAVQSVLRSEFEALEVVLVDDGSRDDTLARLKPLEADRRLRVIAQENRGAHDALNRALSLAGGEFLFILNSDDAFLPERIGRFVQRFEADPSLVVLSSWLQIVDQAGVPLGIKQGFRNMPPWPLPGPGPSLGETGDPILALLEANYVATTSNIGCRRSLLEGPGAPRFLPLRYAHDWDFLLTATTRGGFALIPEPLVDYRVHPSNTIAEGTDRARGQGAMRFEILWVLARHARRILREAGRRGYPAEDLARRAHVSLQRFGRDRLFEQLSLLRGEADQPPQGYDDLLDPCHPFRIAAEEALASSL